MIFNMKELATKGTLRLQGTEDLTGILPVTGSLLKHGLLQVNLDAVSTEQGTAEVTGELNIDVEQSCSRCLNPVHQHVTVPFHETFAKDDAKAKAQAAARKETEYDFDFDLEAEDDEEDDTVYVSEDRVELLPYLAEGVMLALPYIPLCSKDCQGLCPVCGKDRNVEACGCKTDKVDPRMAGLADFFKDS